MLRVINIARKEFLRSFSILGGTWPLAPQNPQRDPQKRSFLRFLLFLRPKNLQIIDYGGKSGREHNRPAITQLYYDFQKKKTMYTLLFWVIMGQISGFFVKSAEMTRKLLQENVNISGYRRAFRTGPRRSRSYTYGVRRTRSRGFVGANQLPLLCTEVDRDKYAGVIGGTRMSIC